MSKYGKARGGHRQKNPPPPDDDQEFLSRGRQLEVLRDCQIPKVPGVVSGIVLKAVLRVLDDHIGGRQKECWPCQDTIAREAGLTNRKHVQRAIKALEDRSLIYKERRGKFGAGRAGAPNHYRIIWNEVALLCPDESIRQAASEDSRKNDQRDSAVPLVPGDQRDFSSRPTGQSVPTNGTALSQEPPSKRPRSAHRPQPPFETAEWAAVVDEFAGRQSAIRRLAEEHRDNGYTPAEFRERLVEAWAVVTLPENRGRFDKPAGAVAWFLRNDSWPVEKVTTPAVAIAEAARRSAKAAAEMRADLREATQNAAADERESTFGSFLDALDEDGLQELIERTPALQDPFFARWQRQRPPRGIVRMMLLRSLADFM